MTARSAQPPPAVQLPTGRARNWGPWKLDAPRRQLVHPAEFYDVDLNRCRSSAQVLDWVAHVAGKAWADGACIAGLVRALDDVLHLQANVCPWEQDRRLSLEQVAELVRHAARHKDRAAA